MFYKICPHTDRLTYWQTTLQKRLIKDPCQRFTQFLFALLKKKNFNIEEQTTGYFRKILKKKWTYFSFLELEKVSESPFRSWIYSSQFKYTCSIFVKEYLSSNHKNSVINQIIALNCCWLSIFHPSTLKYKENSNPNLFLQ